MNAKFLLKPETILQDVEDSYVIFVGDHWNDPDLQSQFSDYLNSKRPSNKLYRIHVNLTQLSSDTIMFETSKFYINNYTFAGRQLWIFTKNSDIKYDLTLKRFKISQE